MFDRVCLIEGTKEGEFDFEEEAIEAGASGDEPPTETAFINEILDILGPSASNRVLISYFNKLFSGASK